MKHLNRQQGVFCLNHGWKFTEKDYSVLPKGKSHEEVYGFSKGGASLGPASSGFDDRKWETVNLPHDWVTYTNFDEKGSPNQGYKERGTAWYRMSFGLLEEDRNKQIVLEFEGMSCDAQIYVNGIVLKRSFSGYNGFCVDMTDMAQFGVVPNIVAVRIDAKAWEGWWYEGAGIYRNVWLVKKPAVHIAGEGVFAKPVRKEDGTWRLEVKAEIENSLEYSKGVKIITQLRDMSGREAGRNEAEIISEGYSVKEVALSIEDIAPELWSPENPCCYEVKTILYEEERQTDFLIQDIGFRYIGLDAQTGFWLNGENIKLKGFCNHQDHAGIGVAVPYSVKEFRMRKLKELGANAYRCAHNPDPEILEICDRIGLMVMEENRTFSSAKDNLEEVKGIIKRARNHPCVILYSAFNEEPLQGTGKGRRMAGSIQATIKGMDNTRPVLGAFNGGYMEEEGAATILDAVGINYNPVRYDEFHRKFPEIPLMGSETASAFMIRGEYETNMDAHIIDSYDNVCAPWGNSIKDAWQYVKERPFVAGTFVWTGFDYRGEPTPFEWPSVATFFGTYDSCGFEKDACYFYKAFWKETPMVHLVSPFSRSTEKDTIKVMVVSNCTHVALYMDDRLLKEADSDCFRPLTAEVKCIGKMLRAVGSIDGIDVTEDTQKKKGTMHKLVIETDKDKLYSGGYDALIVNVSLTDENNTLVEDEDRLVQFEVENGIILGVGNGNPNSHEPDVADYRELFRGRAQLIVRPNDNGNVKITVSGEAVGKESVEVSLEQKPNIPYILPIKEQIVDGWKIYHKLLKEKPAALVSVKANDMNSFEPIAYGRTGQAELEGRYGMYGLYMTRFDVGERASGRYIYFENVLGGVWIYVDGQELFARTENMDGMIAAYLPETLEGDHIITMIVCNANKEWPHAGLCAPAVMRQEK